MSLSNTPPIFPKNGLHFSLSSPSHEDKPWLISMLIEEGSIPLCCHSLIILRYRHRFPRYSRRYLSYKCSIIFCSFDDLLILHCSDKIVVSIITVVIAVIYFFTQVACFYQPSIFSHIPFGRPCSLIHFAE